MHDVIRESHTERQTTLLVRANGHVYDSSWELHEVDLEEIVLAYLGHGDGPPRAHASRGGGVMTWVSWRQQRTETLIAAGDSRCSRRCSSRPGFHMASAYDHDGLSACLGAAHGAAASRSSAFTAASSRSSNLARLVQLVPGLIGVLLAAPFILELETGTYRLAWTQSITRRRWLAGKLGLTVAAALLAALALDRAPSPGGGRRSTTSTGG